MFLLYEGGVDIVTKVKDVMKKKVITIRENASVREVSKLLIKKKLSGVPVVDKNRNLIGFVSEKDIIQSVGSKNFAKKCVKDVMTRDLATADENASLDYISEVFAEKPVRRIPIVKGRKLVGIISRKDIIKRFIGHYY